MDFRNMKNLLADNTYPRIITLSFKERLLEKQFNERMGYCLNLNNPKTFNEKIQWIKLYYHNPLVTKCADKYAVRQYVEKTIGGGYLIPLAGNGIYNKASDIDFDALPEKFALKITDGWARNIVCEDKSKLNREETREQLTEWLDKGRSQYYRNLEWGYKNIKPRILCEEYIEQERDLKDYKIWCFGGKAECVMVCSERGTNLQFDYFDTGWNRLQFTRNGYPFGILDLQPPKSIARMLEVAERLAKAFPFVRVDLYEINGETKFGEMTFTPDNGMGSFEPYEWDEKYGELLVLPKKGFVFPFEINRRKVRFSKPK